MTSFATAVEELDWKNIAHQLNAEGYAVLPGLLASASAQTLADQIDASAALRRVSLASRDLGRGDLDVFEGSLSEPLASARVAFYEHLAPIANRWNETLDVAYRYPASLDDFLQRNRDAGFRKKDLSQGALWKWQLLYIMQIMRSYVDPQWGWHPPHQRRLTYLDRDGLA